MADSTDLALALERAAVDQRDGRALMPLADARAIVEAARDFAGEPTDRDRLWAALLSLENAREFVRHARRLRWHDEPAPPDDVAAFERYGNGLQLLGAYTWSKMIDDVSSVAGFVGAQNPGFTNNQDKRLDKSLSGLDIAQRLVVNYQYELPFGKSGGGVKKALLGGWNVNGVTTLQSGLPLSINSNVSNLVFGGTQRPNRVLASSTRRLSSSPSASSSATWATSSPTAVSPNTSTGTYPSSRTPS